MVDPENSPVEEPLVAPGAIRSRDELAAGARIVYPNQGVCRVEGFSSLNISGQQLEFVTMIKEEDGASIKVPVGKIPTIGLRKVADATEVEDVFELLAASFDDPELDWKVRHRMHGDLLTAGGVLGVAEVLKGLQALANLRPLPQKERERYDAARHLLVNEVSVALGVPLCTAEDFIDLALIPPPGTKRPAGKPRKAVILAPRPQRPRFGRQGKPAADLDLDDLALDLEAEPVEGEPAVEGEAAETDEAAVAEGGAPAGSDAEAELEAALPAPKAPRPPKAPKPPKAPRAAQEAKPAEKAAPGAAPKPAAAVAATAPAASRAPVAPPAVVAPAAAPAPVAARPAPAARPVAGKPPVAVKPAPAKVRPAEKPPAPKKVAAAKKPAEKKPAAKKAAPAPAKKPAEKKPPAKKKK